MNVSLTYHYVAFLDILGFSNLVRHDCEAPEPEKLYLNKLFEVYEKTRQLPRNNGVEIQQFSDSVVISQPYDPHRAASFVNILAKYQYDIFKQGFLCRGGIAVGKHFTHEAFMFSGGLLEAYKLEQQARYPRIVLSPDLIELLRTKPRALSQAKLARQDDGMVFVDYLVGSNVDEVIIELDVILATMQSSNPSIQEKARWLRSYFDHVASRDGWNIADRSTPMFLKFQSMAE